LGEQEYIILLVGTNVGLYVMMTVLNFFPHTFNYLVEITEKNARAQYANARLMMNFMKVELVYLFAYVTWGTVQAALEMPQALMTVS